MPIVLYSSSGKPDPRPSVATSQGIFLHANAPDNAPDSTRNRDVQSSSPPAPNSTWDQIVEEYQQIQYEPRGYRADPTHESDITPWLQRTVSTPISKG
ncbi:unnamed protein product [Umbelopsis ramanniana]